MTDKILIDRSMVEQAQAEQEPVAWTSPSILEWSKRETEKVEKLTRKAQPEYDFTVPLYLHPQPPRQPLTDEQILEVGWAVKPYANQMEILAVARAVEAAHGIGEKK